MTLDWYPETEL